MNQITCPSCGYANEITRVFCHQCGVRLPRTEAQVEEVAQANKVANQKAKVLRQKGPAKRKPPFRFSDFLAGLLASVIKLSLLALVAAAILLALRSPETVPEIPQNSPQTIAAANGLQSKLSEIATIGYSGHLLTNAEQVNSFLSQRIAMQTGQMTLSRFLRPDTLAVSFAAQSFTLFLTYRFFDFPLVLQSTFEAKGESRKWRLQETSSYLGKLPLHPLLVEKAFRWYQPVADTLAGPLQSFSLAAELNLNPKFLRAAWSSEPTQREPIRGFDNAPSMSPRPATSEPSSAATPMQLRGTNFSGNASPTPLQMRGSTSQP